MTKPVHVMTVVGARPQFVKAAAVARAFEESVGAGAARHTLVHTGQHYDEKMSQLFFDELEIPAPDLHLGIHGGTHGQMTGRMIEAIERCLLDDRPDWLLVFGDTNSTLAGAVAAAKLGVPIAHVEAGLRSFNRAMPEEINRVLTDHASDLLFAPTKGAIENLRNEGIEGESVVFCGDVMYDVSLFHKERLASRRSLVKELGLDGAEYALATVHRQENTDDDVRLREIVRGLVGASQILPVVWPMHPRTADRLKRAGLDDAVRSAVRVIEPVGYLDMLELEAGARLILTDSGGVQKEAYFHGVRCLTLRDETEWTELVDAGANELVGADEARIVDGVKRAMGGARRLPTTALYGDGFAARAIVERLLTGVPVPA